MSTIKSGRETDAAVARALGWQWTSGAMRVTGYPPGAEYREPVPMFSTSPADALAALEATGKDYTIVKDGDRYGCMVWRDAAHAANGDEFNFAPTLCLAACAAILQLPSPLPPEPA